VLEEKIDRCEAKQRMILSEKIGRVQEHNHEVVEKIQLTHEKRFEEWMRDQESFFRHLDKIEKKVAAMEKKMNQALQANKEKRQNHLDGQHLRKKDEEHLMKMRARKIMEKFASSGKAVEDYMKEQAHELMLKQELRKLREEDMRK
jgi:hypothetical protein